ncbi:transcription termination factor MTERF15, mitochondrial-like [Quercus robur]|uniref:transcription termination factor MTERF15, mitochondrial-like n=1 Tax=Quercus robur TaxID=38942 RepID=UPI002162D421|nr:transcription termination factor MTERF15, mitochondrial-like [Quercus robur]
MFYYFCKTILNGKLAVRALPPIHRLGFEQNPSLSLKYISSTTTNEQPFAVSYLIKTLGFSPEAALSASKYVHFETPEKADIVVSFFKNHGFSQTQITNLVRRLPSVLISDPDKTLLPKIDFFSSKGISSPDLAKLFSGYPIILKTSLEKQIIPSFDFFKNLLQSEAKTIEAIKRFTGVLKCNVEARVAPNINTLRENGVPESNIVTLLQYQPRAFVVNPVRFREIVEEVKEMGFNPSRLKFALAVLALRAMSKSTWERKVDVYKKWGLSENDIFLAFGRHPWCMMVSEEKIMRVMDLLVNKMGMDSSLFIKRPGLLSLSLEKRLIPRGFVFQGLFSKGLVKKDFNIYPLFECPERTFVQKYIMPHKEEASELLKLYKEKMDSSK